MSPCGNRPRVVLLKPVMLTIRWWVSYYGANKIEIKDQEHSISDILDETNLCCHYQRSGSARQHGNRALWWRVCARLQQLAHRFGDGARVSVYMTNDTHKKLPITTEIYLDTHEACLVCITCTQIYTACAHLITSAESSVCAASISLSTFGRPCIHKTVMFHTKKILPSKILRNRWGDHFYSVILCCM